MRRVVTPAATLLALTCAASCIAHGSQPVGIESEDPLAGRNLSQLHSHGHDILEVHGQLVCSGRCDTKRAKVLSKRYADQSGYAETKVVVEPDGRFHGELAISWSGTADQISYFPQALVFTLPGCEDAIVSVVSPWVGNRVEVMCK